MPRTFFDVTGRPHVSRAPREKAVDRRGVSVGHLPFLGRCALLRVAVDVHRLRRNFRNRLLYRLENWTVDPVLVCERYFASYVRARVRDPQLFENYARS